jgi:amino acid transporter
MNEERKTIKAWEEMGRRKKLKKRYTIWGIFVFISGVFLFGLGLFETITDSAYQHPTIVTAGLGLFGVCTIGCALSKRKLMLQENKEG